MDPVLYQGCRITAKLGQSSHDMPYLNFISDDLLKIHVREVITAVTVAEGDAEKTLYKNVVDPFSAIFDAHFHQMTLSDWLVSEKARQIQKTMQNALGTFHQNILGSMDGWEDLGVGHVFDIRNRERRMIAEVKNKYNTTKGNHKVAIYDDLKNELSKPEYAGFTSYYVEIISQRRHKYDKPFTPSDNRSGRQRPEDERIRVIDGSTFYALASGTEDALKKLYSALPEVIADITRKPADVITSDPLFMTLFNRAF